MLAFHESVEGFTNKQKGCIIYYTLSTPVWHYTKSVMLTGVHSYVARLVGLLFGCVEKAPSVS